MRFERGRLHQATTIGSPTDACKRVAASLRQKAGERGGEQWVEVRVSDTGVGIPAEEIERIFHKFYQSPHHLNPQEHGTGLGQAIARHIVAAHGGRLWVESQVGRGSTFILLLPALDSVHEQSSHSQVAIGTGSSTPAPVIPASARGDVHA